MYTEKQKTVKKEKKVVGKWGDMPFSWLEKFNIVRMSFPSKMIYRFNTIHIRIPARFFLNIEKIILKFKWKRKGNKIGRIKIEESRKNPSM